MSSAATTAKSAPDQLDLYRLRDDLAQNLNPANAYERMLVTQIAESWIRLQRAYDAEQSYFHGRDVATLIATKLDEFKAITRYVTDCERAWRHATLHLQKSQRQRNKVAAPNLRRTPPTPPEALTPPIAPRATAASTETPQRE